MREPYLTVVERPSMALKIAIPAYVKTFLISVRTLKKDCKHRGNEMPDSGFGVSDQRVLLMPFDGRMINA